MKEISKSIQHLDGNIKENSDTAQESIQLGQQLESNSQDLQDCVASLTKLVYGHKGSYQYEEKSDNVIDFPDDRLEDFDDKKAA